MVPRRIQTMTPTYLLLEFALPHLKRGASIIQSSSVTAFKGSPAMVDYSSTKGAIITFTRSLAGQLAPKGIRVNVRSDFLSDSGDHS